MPTTPESWRATLLGAVRIEGQGEAVERLRTRTAFALLVYLLLHRSRAHAREELVERFWPDDDFETARAKLRLALHSIRSAFEGLLHTDRHLVAIAHPEKVWTDRDEFLRLVARVPDVDRPARLAQALALYQGPFLLGFYDEWALEERERLEASLASVLRETAEAYASSERWLEALDAANRLVAVEPYDEGAHVLALRALRGLGRAEATRRYLDWTRDRFAEIGASPGPRIEAFSPAPSDGLDRREEEAFFGREVELSAALDRIGEGLIVTLWGVAGLGKTRLAREAMHTLEAQGVRTAFVSAIGMGSVAALGAALRERLAPSVGPGEETVEALEAAPATVVLIDNFEGLPPDAAPLLARVRAANPGLRFLVTSQRRLGLRDEAVVPLPPLDTPPECASAAQVAASTSVRLLRQRIRERGRRLRVDESNAAALGALCRRLEGLPLALELAAEWLDVLGPAEIVSRLDERGRRLASRFPGRDPRHLSLETAIEASLARLDEPLREAMGTLSAFVGGWDLAAAEALLVGQDAAAALAELEARALVKVEAAGCGMRYAMLESVRLFVRATTSADELDERLRRHASYFVAVGARMQADATSLVAEHRLDDENVRQAAETTLEREADPERAATAIGGFQGYWQKMGRWDLAKRCLVRALERLPDEPSLLRARLYNWLAYAAAHLDDQEIVEASLARQVEIHAALGDDHRLAVVKGAIGSRLVERGDHEAAIPLLRGFWPPQGVKTGASTADCWPSPCSTLGTRS